MEITSDETIANKISGVLAERIVRGILVPGTKLRQDHIAEEFNTSHVPVREALRVLEARGLAVSEARRGVRVASFTSADIEEVTRMRSVLEGLALRHAAPNLTPNMLDQAESIARMGDKATDISQQEEANKQFHELLLTPCRMPKLLTEIGDLHLLGSRAIYIGKRNDGVPRVDSDHHAILRHLRAGNLETAVLTLERHILRSIEKPNSGRANA